MEKTVVSKDITKSIPTPKKRRGIKNFWIDVVREMKKVEWPSIRETNRLTGVVLIVCAFVVGILTLLSMAAGEIVNLLQGKVS